MRRFTTRRARRVAGSDGRGCPPSAGGLALYGGVRTHDDSGRAGAELPVARRGMGGTDYIEGVLRTAEMTYCRSSAQPAVREPARPCYLAHATRPGMGRLEAVTADRGRTVWTTLEWHRGRPESSAFRYNAERSVLLELEPAVWHDRQLPHRYHQVYETWRRPAGFFGERTVSTAESWPNRHGADIRMYPDIMQGV